VHTYTSRMHAYVCVYQHPSPGRSDRAQTEAAAESDPLLGRYLDAYDADGSCLDWGDDPSFFCASELLGDLPTIS